MTVYVRFIRVSFKVSDYSKEGSREVQSCLNEPELLIVDKKPEI